VFGSLARGEARLGSDVDILIELDRPDRVDLLDCAGIVGQIADTLPGMHVDVAERNYLTAVFVSRCSVTRSVSSDPHTVPARSVLREDYDKIMPQLIWHSPMRRARARQAAAPRR
jgi:predicted nucleotidyltransferase